MATLLLLASALASATCPADVSGLSSDLDRAEKAFVAMDAGAFYGAVDAALSDADCLSEHLDPAQAARLHRAVGLRAFLSDDETRARQSFAAARAADPSFVFSESFLPRNHPVWALYASSAELSSSSERVPPPLEGVLEFDGDVTTQRPTAWPTLAVLVQPDGAVRRSAFLDPGEPLFDYPQRERMSPRVPLLVGAGVSAVASGVMYGMAKMSFDRFWDPLTTEPELVPLMNRTNALYYGSIGAGVVAVGAGAGALVFGSR